MQIAQNLYSHDVFHNYAQPGVVEAPYIGWATWHIVEYMQQDFGVAVVLRASGVAR